MSDPLPTRPAEAVPRVLLPAVIPPAVAPADGPSDNDLIAGLIVPGRSASEREALFQQLHQRHAEPLLSFLTRFTSDQSLRDDLAQEAWLRVLQKANKYRHGNFRAWLFTIATNVWRSIHRKDARQVALDEEQAGVLPDSLAVDALDELSQAEDYRQLRQCVELLPDRHRQVVRGRLADNDNEAIATYLGISKARCYSLFFEAKQLLLDCIEKHRT